MGNSNSVNKNTTIFNLIDKFLLDYAWDRQTLEFFYNTSKSTIPLNEIKKGLENILKIQEYMLNYYKNINSIQNQSNITKIQSNITRLKYKIENLNNLKNNKTKRAKEALELYYNYYSNIFVKHQKAEKKYIEMILNINF